MPILSTSAASVLPKTHDSMVKGLIMGSRAKGVAAVATARDHDHAIGPFDVETAHVDGGKGGRTCIRVYDE